MINGQAVGLVATELPASWSFTSLQQRLPLQLVATALNSRESLFPGESYRARGTPTQSRGLRTLRSTAAPGATPGEQLRRESLPGLMIVVAYAIDSVHSQLLKP